MTNINIRKKQKERVTFKDGRIQLPFSGNHKTKNEWYHLFKELLLLEKIQQDLKSEIQEINDRFTDGSKDENCYDIEIPKVQETEETEEIAETEKLEETEETEESENEFNHLIIFPHLEKKREENSDQEEEQEFLLEEEEISADVSGKVKEITVEEPEEIYGIYFVDETTNTSQKKEEETFNTEGGEKPLVPEDYIYKGEEEDYYYEINDIDLLQENKPQEPIYTAAEIEANIIENQKRQKEEEAKDFFKTKKRALEYKKLSLYYQRNKLEQENKIKQLDEIAKFLTLREKKEEQGINPVLSRKRTKRLAIIRTETPEAKIETTKWNPYFKVNDSRFARLCLKRKKRLKKRNHLGSIRAKFKEAKIKSYIGRFINVGSEETTYSNIVKTNQLKIINIVFALKNNRKIPPKYKKVKRYSIKLAKTNIMRFAPLNIPEFVPWSLRILQQSNGEY